MSRREEREQMAAQWLEHLRAWKSIGGSLSAYVRQHGLALASAYQWRRALIRQGLWSEAPKSSRRVERVPLRFARVTVTDASRASALILRVQLVSGRRADIELHEVAQLAEVLSVLEQPA